ncbi:O-antigen polymerase [Paenibacillus rhizoplanae]|uniref:O-antigen polymerase n=1 Tax=Paenibacillus rhizoplanae TaxID=1917181 RepID=A0ABW5FHD4_9BACL
MSYLIGLICILFVFLSYKYDHKLYNPYILFNLWWGTTIFISGLGLFGIYIPNVNTYFLMLLAIVFFNLSAFFKFRKINKSTLKITINKNHNNNENKSIKFVIFMELIIIAYLLKRTILVLKLLLSGMSYQTIRYEFFYADNINNGYDQLVNAWFVLPIITFSIILLSLMIIEKRNNRVLLILTLISVGQYSFSSGGRSLLLTSGLILIMSWMISKDKVKVSFLSKIKIRISMIVLVIAMFTITIFRNDTLGNPIIQAFKTIVLYFTAPYIYFENLIGLVIQDKVTLYGGAFFGGIIDVFVLFCRYIGFDLTQISTHVGKYNQLYLSVGDSSYYNAFPTMIFTFFYDFGYLGIVLESFIFGLMANYFYGKMKREDSTASKGIYIIIVIMIYESVMRWIGTSATPWIVILLLFIFDKISKFKKT